jgi:hypothetical protein
MLISLVAIAGRIGDDDDCRDTADAPAANVLEARGRYDFLSE